MNLKDLIDNQDMNKVMDVLENMEDEQLSVELLKKFNDRTKELGELIMNQDPKLDHGHWKAQCDDAKKAVEEVVKEIFSYQK
ncbi:hypothetical protein BALOs_1174 [Halobacteriovorax sp. BALOs_7]|uniref:hypothetical protein n=1 Tax=Halobacteriovorax sp. BALOs_7 TaxID=2109558 RepID=UPI000EA23BF4|nr:hypothetical protein [Halobacteriovorax sp. BALOs_7]AYF44181.1 hypothetical protein BALOs_1174 [Halobacteriovorax sp. BALOs_7]